MFDFGRHPRLCAGRLKRQIGQKLIFQLTVLAERLSVKTLRARTQCQHAEVMRQQLFEN